MMKSAISFLAILFIFQSMGFSQGLKLDADYKESSIQKIVELINEFYVFPDLAQATSQHLMNELEKGKFDEFNKMTAFAAAITETVQSVNKDRHMSIRAMIPRETEERSPERFMEDLLDAKERVRENAAGFMKVEMIDDHVGYLDIRSFEHVEAGSAFADAYMALLSGSDAIIIDLRQNGGGDPAMVQYLCSYFFDDETHLNSIYWRDRDRTDEFWTIPVNGRQLPDVPLIILTSGYTFSGAEEFAYNMQTRKRATIIGEVTGGGANPGMRFTVNEFLSINIPMGTAINPVTGTNWEGTGVTPDIEVPADEAMDKALRLAHRSAHSYKTDRQMNRKAISDKLISTLDKIDENTSESLWTMYEKVMIIQLTKAVDEGWLDEGEINSLGYLFLQNDELPAASMVFKCNTILYPGSANTYDSYAESLAGMGRVEEAIENYRKAVQMAAEQNSPMLDTFKENLQKAGKQ